MPSRFASTNPTSHRNRMQTHRSGVENLSLKHAPRARMWVVKGPSRGLYGIDARHISFGPMLGLIVPASLPKPYEGPP